MDPHDSSDPGDPALPDPFALRRRVLLTAVITFVLFLTAAYVLTALAASSRWLVLIMAVLFAGVIRPMMRPVREATALRRRLAYQAFVAQREDAIAYGDDPSGYHEDPAADREDQP